MKASWPLESKFLSCFLPYFEGTSCAARSFARLNCCDASQMISFWRRSSTHQVLQCLRRLSLLASRRRELAPQSHTERYLSGFSVLACSSTVLKLLKFHDWIQLRGSAQAVLCDSAAAPEESFSGSTSQVFKMLVPVSEAANWYGTT